MCRTMFDYINFYKPGRELKRQRVAEYFEGLRGV